MSNSKCEHANSLLFVGLVPLTEIHSKIYSILKKAVTRKKSKKTLTGKQQPQITDRVKGSEKEMKTVMCSSFFFHILILPTQTEFQRFPADFSSTC